MISKPIVHEAQVLSRYLTGKEIPERAVGLYTDALSKLGLLDLGPEGNRLWKRMMQYPYIIGPIDSALALDQPHSPVRKRIYVMLAILETQPELSALFLPVPFSKRDTLLTFLKMFLIPFKVLAGWILLMFF